MTLLNFSDSGEKPAGRKKPLRAILGIGALVGAVALGSTLAASINLNDSGPVEFGQGVTQTVACSGNDSIIVTPTSSFINADGVGDYYFTSVTLSSIPSGCNGVDFTIAAYDNSGNIMRLSTSFCSLVGEKPVVNFDGSDSAPTEESSNEMFSEVIDADSSSFTLRWIDGMPNGCSSAALAEDVYRITIESSGVATGAVVISCDSVPNDAPSYYPCGPQQNVPISTITNAGWTQCYSEDFGADMGDNSIDSILQSCTGTYLIFTGKELAGDTALLMAAGPSASISLETPLNSPNSINGSWWYYTKDIEEADGSFGFSGSQSINQDTCDFGDNDETSSFRYCLHLNDSLYGGFRIGTLGADRSVLNLNDGPTAYLKVVYQFSEPS